MRELPTSIASLKVVELRVACTERGLPSSGLKAELVKRLEVFRAEQEEGDAVEEQENGEEACEDHVPVSDSLDLPAPAAAEEDGKELEKGSAGGLQTGEGATKNDDGEAEASASSTDDAGVSAKEGADATSASTSDAVQRAVEEEQAAEPEVEQAKAIEEAPVEGDEPVNGMETAEHDGHPTTEAAVESTGTEQQPEQDEAEEDLENLNLRRSGRAAAEDQPDVPPSAKQETEESTLAPSNEPEQAVEVMAEQPETEMAEQTDTSAIALSIEPAAENSEEGESAVKMEVDAGGEGEKRKAEELGDVEEGGDGGARKRVKVEFGTGEEAQQAEVTKEVSVKSEGKGESGEEGQKRQEHQRQHEDEEEGEVHEEKKPLGRQAEKGTELFVGGIGYNISEDELRKVFAAHGEIVDLRVIRDRMGQPKGFGFVRYAKRDAADKAIAALDRVDVHGRRLQVSKSQHTDHVYITNLPEGWGDSEVRAFLEKKALFGVEEIEVVMDEDGKSKGLICVQFDNHQHALQCYKAANTERLEAEGRTLRVDWTAPGEGRRRDGGEEVIVRTCFVGNLPPSTTEEELQTLLSVHGEVERVTLGKDTARRTDAFAFVRFKDRDIAHKAYDACKANKPELRGSQLEVEMAKAPTSRTRGRSRSRDRLHDRRSRNTSYDRRDRDYGRDRGGSGYRDRDRDGGRYGRERDRSRERGGGYGRDREREWGGGGGGRFEGRSRGYDRGGYDDDRGGGYRERDRGVYPRDNRDEFMAGRTYEPQSYQAEPPLRGGPTTDSYGSYRDRSRSPRYPSARQPLPTAQPIPAPAAPRYYSGPPTVSGAPYQPARPLAPVTHPFPYYNPAPVAQPSSYAAPAPAVHGYAATPVAAPYSQHLQPSAAPSSSGYVAGGIGAGMSAGALSPPVAGGGMRGQGSYGGLGNLPPYGR